MEQRMVDRIYDTVTGMNTLSGPMDGVENLFAPGSACDQLYSRVLDAYGRLCCRLGTEEEDPDVEVIINSLMAIERKIAYTMYEYGAKYGVKP